MPNQLKTFPNFLILCRTTQAIKEIEKIRGTHNNHTKPFENIIPHHKRQTTMKKKMQSGFTHIITPNTTCATSRG
jgi:hypothetical protein